VIADVPEPLTAKAFDVDVGHSIVNELPVAVTASLKLRTTFVLVATVEAPSAGDVLLTLGALSCVVNEKE
jgi:hypothetical protein